MNTQTWWPFSTCLSGFKYGIILGIYEKTSRGVIYWDGVGKEFCVSPRFGREDFVGFASMWVDSNEIWYFWWKKFGDITTTWHVWNPSKSWDICFNISTGYLDFLSINSMKSKKSNQTKSSPTKGTWCNLLRVLGVLLAPLLSQVLRSMAPLPLSAHMGWWDPSAKMHGCTKANSWPHQENQCPETNCFLQLNINKRWC